MKRNSIVFAAVVGMGALLCQSGAAQEMEPPSSMPVRPISFDAVYVVNGGDGMTGSISVINVATNRVERTIELMNAMWPHHIYMSADRSRLLVAVPGMDLSMGHGEMPPGDMMGAVLLVSARTGATIKSVMLPAMNHNAVFSPSQREVWTSQMMMPGSVLALSATSLETIREIPVGDMPAEVTFSPGGLAFVANGGSDSVTVIDPRTKRPVKTIPVGDNPVVPSHGVNGLTYVDNEESMTVSAIDQRTLRVVFTYNLGFMPGMAVLGPDGHLWVTDSEAGRVVLYSPTRDVLRHVIPVGDGAHAIAFSGDGRTAYVTNQMADTVSVIDVARRAVKATVPVGHKPNGLLWRAHTH